MEILEAIDALDEVVHLSPGWSRYRHKRVDQDEWRRAVGRLRSATTVLSPSGRDQVLPLLDRLDDVARAARRIPGIGGVLVRRDAVYDILDELRQLVPRDLIAQRTSSSDESGSA